MRILLSSTHKYPALSEVGSGLHPRPFPSGSGFLLHDLLARGLAELGHEVFYLLPQGADKPLPAGVTLVAEPVEEVDILHTIVGRDAGLAEQWQARHKPWVATCHIDPKAIGEEGGPMPENWIFVSRTLAELHGRKRYVLNGIDPSEYIYSETKGDYFFFMSAMYWGKRKGLDVALSLSQKMGFKLVVAGTDGNYQTINRVAELCAKIGATYVGDTRGKEKAELLAGAKGLIFPTTLHEAFGLVMAEALMSGTPVICSDRGACPEIISPDVGFVCKSEADYMAAINNIATISPQACRDKAMNEYHYLRMAAGYVSEYQREVNRYGD